MLPIHALLRAATADAHARLDAQMPYVDPALTRDGYAAVLRRTRAFHAALEPALGRWSSPLAALGVDLAARSKLGLLDRDLAALGGDAWGADAPDADAPDAPGAAGAAGEEVAALPSTLARAFGALYVMEGATLGGQVIRRQLATSLGLSEANGAAYLASYGDRTGAMWKAFLASAARFAASHPEAATPDGEIVRGALDTFAAFERRVAIRA